MAVGQERAADGLSGGGSDVARILAGIPLFAGVPDQLLERIAAAARVVTVPAGQELFRQGDPAGPLYIVLAGRLEVVRLRDGGDGTELEVLRHLRRGASVGELALLTDSPRSATVRAVRDSEVVELDRATFDEMLLAGPELGRAMLTQLAKTLQMSGGRLSAEDSEPRVFTVLAAAGLPARDIADRLAAAMAHFGTTAVAQQAEPADGSPGRLLDRLEHTHDRVVLVAGGDDAEWDDFCLRQADRVVVLGSSAAPPPRGVAPGRSHVAFFGAPGTGTERRRWLNRLEPLSHHHIPDGGDRDLVVSRIARRLLGRSLGLVLSGGGARGLAHIGAIEVLLEQGLEIDRVAGCSMGSYIGAMFAMGLTPAEIADVCRRELVDAKPFADYTVPRVALIRAARAEEMLQRVFGSTTIEELPRDYFCVSCDLVSAKTVVHRQGPVFEAVGTSMSIPGLAPPVRRGEAYLVDGGLLDNMPVDIMAREPGPIVAVDVMGEGWEPHTVGHDGHPVPRDRMWWLRAVRGQGPERLPKIAETLARTTVIGSWRAAEESRQLASVLVQPEVGNTGVLDFHLIDRMIDLGRQATLAALEHQPLPV